MGLGRYELVRPLAASGMAELHLARIDERLVLIKRLLPVARRRTVVDQFLAEARIAAALVHPNLVKVEEIVEGPPDWYYVTEHLPGANLLDCMKVLTMQSRAVPIECAVAIGIEICDGLAFAHAHRDAEGAPIVHRNVSPLNVLLGFDGSIKLGHFGCEGTLGYMSPEQCRGDAIDARSDVFSLGIVLYEIATGRRLFGSRDPADQINDRILRGEIAPPSRHRPTVPPALEDVIVRALQRDRADRYADALEMRADLERSLLAGAPSRGAVGELVRRALHDTPAHGTRIVRDDDVHTVVRTTSREMRAAATAEPPTPPPPAPSEPVVQLDWRRRPSNPHTEANPVQRTLPAFATQAQTRLVIGWQWARHQRWPLAAAVAALALAIGLSGWAMMRASPVTAALPAAMPVEPREPPPGIDQGTRDDAPAHKSGPRRARR